MNQHEIDSRILYLFGEINEEKLDVIKNLHYLDSISDDPITVYINSGGGLTHIGLGIYDSLQALRSPIKTIGIGQVGSIALIVLQAGDDRRAYPHTEFFFHSQITMLEEEQLSLKDLRSWVDNTENVNNTVWRILKIKMFEGKNRNDYSINHFINKKRDSEWYFYTETAIYHNLIDAVVE